MKIAVTSENGEVFQHFGHCREFTIYTAENGAVTDKKVLDASGSGHSALAVLLGEHKVNVLICGGIGGGARTALAQQNIDLVPGVSGSTDEAVRKYLAGEPQGDPDYVCSHHSHEHHGHGEGCGEHCSH